MPEATPVRILSFSRIEKWALSKILLCRSPSSHLPYAAVNPMSSSIYLVINVLANAFA